MTADERRERMNELFFEMEVLATELDEMEDEYSALEVYEDEEESEEEPGQE